ncbi:MAG: toxic anion resistance protein [Eubacteriales bacterium]
MTAKKALGENLSDTKNMAASIDLEDAQKVMVFGIRAQQDLADFSSQMLDQLRSIKTGDIEAPLEALLDEVQSVSLSGLDANDRNTKRFMKKAKKVLARYNKADKRIFELEMRLDTIKGDLTRDVVLMDKLLEKNLAHREVLETYIAAGETVLAEKTKAAKSKAASVLEEGSALSVLEKRIYDLKLAHTIAMQTEPQIGLIQSTNRTLIARIQTSLLSTIPLWRGQMVLANTLVKQRNVMNMEKSLSEAADEKLKAGAEALKQVLAKGENPLVAVQKSGEELVKTIEVVKKAYDSGETDIEAAMKAIDELSRNMEKNK